MKKIPSLEELRRTAAADGPVDGDGPAVPAEVASLADLPDEVLAHAVKLGESEDGPAGGGSGAVAGSASDAAGQRERPRGPKRKAGSRLAVRRRYSRERAAQALYAWDIGDASASEVLRYFLDHQDMSRADVDWFREAFTGVAHDPAPVDALIEPVIDRGFDELDPVERAILRLGCWELMTRRETPVRVTINEGVEVAKRFGAEQGHRFVNGVLDAIAREIRGDELGAPDRSRSTT